MDNNDASIAQQRNEGGPVEHPTGSACPVEDSHSCPVSLLRRLLEAVVGLLFGIRARSPWLTICEAERYAHAPHGAINKAIKDGELPAYQRTSNTVMLVDVDEVNEWMHDKWKVRYVDGKLRRAR